MYEYELISSTTYAAYEVIAHMRKGHWINARRAQGRSYREDTGRPWLATRIAFAQLPRERSPPSFSIYLG